jgi:branched-chain amino acid transport system ATP-binding protein
MELLLETKHLRKEFGGLVAVDDVSIQVAARSLHSIIGPNGAGKTTLFNLLSGVFPPTRGQVIFKGQDITHTPPHRMAHLGIGRSFQITNIFPNLTVLENIRMSAQAMGKDNFRLFMPADELKKYVAKAMEVIGLVNLTGKEGMLAKALPHGDKRKLELGIMLASCWMNRRRACRPNRCRRCSKLFARFWPWAIRR